MAKKDLSAGSVWPRNPDILCRGAQKSIEGLAKSATLTGKNGCRGMPRLVPGLVPGACAEVAFVAAIAVALVATAFFCFYCFCCCCCCSLYCSFCWYYHCCYCCCCCCCCCYYFCYCSLDCYCCCWYYFHFFVATTTPLTAAFAVVATAVATFAAVCVANTSIAVVAAAASAVSFLLLVQALQFAESPTVHSLVLPAEGDEVPHPLRTPLSNRAKELRSLRKTHSVVPARRKKEVFKLLFFAF